MFKRLLAFACLSLSIAGCLVGTASDTADVNNTITFDTGSQIAGLQDAGTLPVGVGAVTIEASVPISISDTLSKFGQFGTIALSVVDSTITYNGSYTPLQNITIYLDYGQDMSSDPAMLVNYNFNTNDPPTVDVPLLKTGQQLYNILAKGPVTMLVNLTINPSGQGIPASGDIVIQQHIGLKIVDSVSK